MRRIEAVAHARAGLIGNPSDGYFGKTISCALRDFAARVVIYDWPTLEILPSEQDHVRFASLAELAEDVRRNGYYGGLRLLKAALKRFHEYCEEHAIELPPWNFSIHYASNIPRQVGLAGSSAIITATFRALMSFYHVEIPRHILPNWVLSVERNELGISAGLQDRVAQAYEGLVYMDFAKEKLERDGYGAYEPLDPKLLPQVYLAYQTRLAEGSEVMHNNLRERWEKGDPEVHAAMQRFGELTAQARECLLAGDHEGFSRLMDANFDLRRSIVAISKGNLQMVETARACGASAKFAGSGGAIVGSFPSPAVFEKLKDALGRIGCRVIQPRIAQLGED